MQQVFTVKHGQMGLVALSAAHGYPGVLENVYTILLLGAGSAVGLKPSVGASQVARGNTADA